MQETKSLLKFRKPVLVSSSPKAESHTEDILDSILPPKKVDRDGQLWVQSVSSTPATRLEVVQLQDNLDSLLKQRHARETGICVVRRELFSQLFDELIRQVTIECAERGLLLVRVRDELMQTLEAYQCLYESAVAFGIRKALQAEQGKAEMEANLEKLSNEKSDLERNVQELKAKIEAIERRAAEQKNLYEQKHASEVSSLKHTNLQLKNQLEQLLAPSTGGKK
ncbi:hypothetical protein PCE1_000935 [Barthelona sp. PCE]